MLEEAVDSGVNFIHSSYEYGTRWLTGEVLGKHHKRHDLHHIIKVNVPDWGEPTFDKETFRARIEEALRELNVERIAVVQHLHRGTLERELGYCAEGESKRLSEYDAVTEPLAEDDRMRDAQADRFYDQLAELPKELPPEPESWTAFAIRFPLADPRITGTVVGINTPEQLRTALQAVEGNYPDRAVVESAHRVCTTFRERFGVKVNTAGVPVY
ncbi:MAG: aldo/keto reductase [Spirochaetota bacterium]